MTSLEYAPSPNLEQYDDVFDYCEEYVPDLEEQQALFTSCEADFDPKILAPPELGEEIDELIRQGVAINLNANHRLFEDQFQLAAAISANALGRLIKKRPTRILAKSPYFVKEWQRKMLYRIGAIPAFRTKDLGEDISASDRRLELIREAGKRSTRTLVRLMKRGETTVQFGSGERESLDDPAAAQEMKKGIGHLIYHANEEKLPIAVVNFGIAYESPDDPKSAHLSIMPPMTGLKGSPEEITGVIQENLREAVGLAAISREAALLGRAS